MFEMMHEANFTYDSSMPVYENKPPVFPYTLDYKMPHDCMIPPCPERSYPGNLTLMITLTSQYFAFYEQHTKMLYKKVYRSCLYRTIITRARIQVFSITMRDLVVFPHCMGAPANAIAVVYAYIKHINYYPSR